VLGINVNNSTRSVKLTAFDTVVLQDPKDGEVYEVEFRGRHKKILTPADPDEEIDISPALEEALEMNVASRVYSAMNGEANILKARELMAKYEEACQIVSAEDLLSETETDEHDRLRASGWV
jgi:1,2-phenylacetyl-CoA epoxidase PaaB subunit